jgi:hypothetical protein
VIVGGMPDVVNSYIKTHDLINVFNKQKNILDSIHDDIKKYAGNKLNNKIDDCFNSVPIQLSREYKKFSFKNVCYDARIERYIDAIKWLEEANLINVVYNLENVEIPLKANSIKNEFKIYMSDIGLLTCMYGQEAQNTILTGELGIYKGAIYENLVADMLSKAEIEMNYYS